jgi:hypothetical protein
MLIPHQSQGFSTTFIYGLLFYHMASYATPSLSALLISLFTPRSRKVLDNAKTGMMSLIQDADIDSLIPKGTSKHSRDFVLQNRHLLGTSTIDVMARGYSKMYTSYKASSKTLKILYYLLIGFLIFAILPVVLYMIINVCKTKRDILRTFLFLLFAVFVSIPWFMMDK